MREQMDTSPLTDRNENLNRFLDSSLIALEYDSVNKREEKERKQTGRDSMPNSLVDSLFDSNETEVSMRKARRNKDKLNHSSKPKAGDPSRARIDRLRRAIMQGSLDNFQ